MILGPRHPYPFCKDHKAFREIWPQRDRVTGFRFILSFWKMFLEKSVDETGYYRYNLSCALRNGYKLKQAGL